MRQTRRSEVVVLEHGTEVRRHRRVRVAYDGTEAKVLDRRGKAVETMATGMPTQPTPRSWVFAADGVEWLVAETGCGCGGR